MNGLNKGFLRKVIKMMCQTPELMLDSTQLVKDVGTLLEGEDAVREGLIDAVGGISDALKKLQAMIEANKK